jgi:protein-S-isoprenylcysteine O-methyltransferase Ste14
MDAALSTCCEPFARPRARSRAVAAVVLDWIERTFILALYGGLVVRLVMASLADGALGNLVLLPSEGLVLLFIMIRRTTNDVSRSPAHWALALGATAAPMLVQAAPGRSLVPPAVGVALILMGMVVQVHAKLVLGRSMGCVPANRGLKFSGPYRHLRHPMYAGYLLGHFGFLLMNPVLANAALYLACLAMQVPRLLIEERLLSRDPLYVRYTTSVRYRLFPGIF